MSYTVLLSNFTKQPDRKLKQRDAVRYLIDSILIPREGKHFPRPVCHSCPGNEGKRRPNRKNNACGSQFWHSCRGGCPGQHSKVLIFYVFQEQLENYGLQRNHIL